MEVVCFFRTVPIPDNFVSMEGHNPNVFGLKIKSLIGGWVGDRVWFGIVVLRVDIPYHVIQK
jgi:hypothetical protein